METINKGVVLTATLLMIALWLILYLMPSFAAFISLGVAVVVALYFLALFTSIRKSKRWGQVKPAWSLSRQPSFLIILLIALPFVFGGILILKGILDIISVTVLTGLASTFFFNLLTVPLALYHRHLESKTSREPLQRHPLVSIVVPAHNEETYIEKAIEALLETDYPAKEIIVVDDGSTDRTYEIASRYAERGVKVLSRPHGGKWAALNYGIFSSKGKIIVTVDADSLVGRHSLTYMVRRFNDPKVMAVCGNVRVLNKRNFLTKCQALEYVISINIIRRAFDLFGSVTVVPGVLGAFRREALAGGGFYGGDTLTEDLDITIKTLKAGSVVQASSYAYAYTEAPETLKDLYRQRSRWSRGNFQNLVRHRDAFLNPRFGFLYELGFPYLAFSTLFIPFADIAVIISAFMAILMGNIVGLAIVFATFVTLQFLLSMLALQLDEEDPWLAVYAPFFVVGYKHLIDFIIIKSIFDVILKRRMGWTRVERRGMS